PGRRLGISCFGIQPLCDRTNPTHRWRYFHWCYPGHGGKTHYLGTELRLGTNHRCPATAWSQVDLQLGGLAYLAAYLAVVACVTLGSDSVLVSRHGEISWRQERQIKIQIARRPVAHSPDVPVLSTPPCQQDVLGNAAVKDSGLIPYRRYRTKEIHDFWLSQVV